MLTAFLVMLREGFEATLVVAILYAYLVRSDRAALRPALWAGVGVAALVSAVAGVALHAAVDGLEGAARLHAFAAVSAAAVGVLTWMVLWMRTHARTLRGELHASLDEALSRRRSVAWAVALAAGIAVLRESLEATLFLVAVATGSDGWRVAVGGLVGLAVAATLGWAVVQGALRMPLATFFRVTGMVLVVFAAGLLARTVGLLQTAGDVGSLDPAAYDLTGLHWLTHGSDVGRFLAAMVGWDPRPSVEQVVAWVGYAVAVGWLFLRPVPTPAPRLSPARTPAPR